MTQVLGDATINELEGGLAGSLVRPGDGEYEEARHIWNGAIDKRPAVVNNALAVQTMGNLTLGFDHRIIDGAVADGFMSRVKHALEHWDGEQA